MGELSTEVVHQAVLNILALDARLKEEHGGRRPLEFYRGVGEMINDLPGGYDSNRVCELAKALAKQNVTGSGVNTLYKMAKFAAATNVADVMMMDQKKVAWRAAVGLTTKNLTDGQRLQMIQQLKRGVLKPAEIGERIRSGISPMAKAGKLSVTKAFTRAENAVQLLLTAAKFGNETATEKLELLSRLLDNDP